MDIFYSITLAAVRLALLCFLLYIFHHKIYGKKNSFSILDNFVLFISLAVSGLLWISFILNQIRLMDLLVLLVVIIGYLLIGLLDFSSKENFIRELKRLKNEIGYWVIRNFEIRPKKKDKKETYRKAIKEYFTAGILTAGGLYFFTFLFRYFFSGVDLFIFSDIWYADLDKVNDLPHFYFLEFPEVLEGEYLLIKLYALITGLSNYIALYSFGLLQAGILAVLIFWFINHVTHHKIALGLLGSLTFAVFYAFLPINIFSLFEHSSVYSALIFSFPAIVLSAKPEMTPHDQKNYFVGLFLLFSAVFFTDLYVGLLVLIPIVGLVLICSPASIQNRKKVVVYSLGAAVILLFCLFSIYSWYQKISFLSLLNSLLFSFNAYPYYPQLLLPLEDLKSVYLFVTFIGLIPAIFLFWKNPKQYLIAFVILLYGVMAVAIFPFFPDYIDGDLLNKLLTVFVPIISVINLFFIAEAIRTTLFDSESLWFYQALGIILLLMGGYIHVKDDKYEIRDTNRSELATLKAYHQLHQNLLPHSYVVINTGSNFIMSEGSHYFMFYEDFVQSYLEMDSIYALNKEDSDFLRTNPESILTPYTYVFVYKNDIPLQEDSEGNNVTEEQILGVVSQLKKRGREVTITFDSPYFNVYQIKNKPENNLIHELISQ